MKLEMYAVMTKEPLFVTFFKLLLMKQEENVISDQADRYNNDYILCVSVRISVSLLHICVETGDVLQD